MSKLEHDKLDYLVAIISDFALKFSLTPTQAYRYLSNYKAIDFLIRNYDIEHTLSRLLYSEITTLPCSSTETS